LLHVYRHPTNGCTFSSWSFINLKNLSILHLFRSALFLSTGSRIRLKSPTTAQQPVNTAGTGSLAGRNGLIIRFCGAPPVVTEICTCSCTRCTRGEVRDASITHMCRSPLPSLPALSPSFALIHAELCVPSTAFPWHPRLLRRLRPDYQWLPQRSSVLGGHSTARE
jgi:hypothetical protein